MSVDGPWRCVINYSDEPKLVAGEDGRARVVEPSQGRCEPHPRGKHATEAECMRACSVAAKRAEPSALDVSLDDVKRLVFHAAGRADAGAILQTSREFGDAFVDELPEHKRAQMALFAELRKPFEQIDRGAFPLLVARGLTFWGARALMHPDFPPLDVRTLDLLMSCDGAATHNAQAYLYCFRRAVRAAWRVGGENGENDEEEDFGELDDISNDDYMLYRDVYDPTQMTAEDRDAILDVVFRLCNSRSLEIVYSLRAFFSHTAFAAAFPLERANETIAAVHNSLYDLQERLNAARTADDVLELVLGFDQNAVAIWAVETAVRAYTASSSALPAYGFARSAEVQTVVRVLNELAARTETDFGAIFMTHVESYGLFEYVFREVEAVRESVLRDPETVLLQSLKRFRHLHAPDEARKIRLVYNAVKGDMTVKQRITLMEEAEDALGQDAVKELVRALWGVEPGVFVRGCPAFVYQGLD